MPYMDSNEPYNRVDNGITAGLVSGAVIGGAQAGVAHYLTGRMARNYVKNYRSDFHKLKQNFYDTANNIANNKKLDDLVKLMGINQAANIYQASRENMINDFRNSKKLKMYQKGFGSGKAKAISYGASILGGAILGGAIDYVNNQ